MRSKRAGRHFTKSGPTPARPRQLLTAELADFGPYWSVGLLPWLADCSGRPWADAADLFDRDVSQVSGGASGGGNPVPGPKIVVAISSSSSGTPPSSTRAVPLIDRYGVCGPPRSVDTMVTATRGSRRMLRIF